MTLKNAVDKISRQTVLLVKKSWQFGRGLAVHPERQVVFVAGVQRSGTNMLMDVLERSLLTDVYHERDGRAFDNYQMRSLSVVDGLRNQSPGSLFIIKSLCELQDLSQMMERYAPAKTVWIVRHFDDVVNSMLVSFNNQAAQVMRVAQDPGSDDWRGLGMSDDTHALVKRLVAGGVDDASAAALQWYFRNILFFEQGFDRNPDVLLIQYEDLVTQPGEQFRKVFKFLDLPYSPWHSKHVVASSIRRREPPVIAPDIRAVCEELQDRFHRLANREQE